MGILESMKEHAGVSEGSAQDNGEYSGIDCYADDRDAFNDFAKYFNNAHLSDVCLRVGDEKYASHKIILCRSSDVFDRMLSKQWNKQSVHELKLSEEDACRPVFSVFLRFLYCNHVVLNDHNVLPLLILADKYAVQGLRKITVNYAIKHVLPFVNLKTLIHVWFKYATTAYHRDLTRECVQKIAKHFWHIISDEEWEEDWLSLDRDQLIELLKSSDLIVANECVLWLAVLRWFNAPQHPQRRGPTASPLVTQVLPLIRFPYMTADELADVESSTIAQQHQKVLTPLTHLAFKYISMPLSSRATSTEFQGIQFLVRNYTDIRWDKRVTITAEELRSKHDEYRFNITTRSSTFPLGQWDWELLFLTRNSTLNTAYSIAGSRNQDELSIELKSIDLDQQRSVEYLLSIVDDKQILRTFAGKKTFTKSRTTESLELENRLHSNELFGNEPSLLHNGELNLQLILRPIV